MIRRQFNKLLFATVGCLMWPRESLAKQIKSLSKQAGPLADLLATEVLSLCATIDGDAANDTELIGRVRKAAVNVREVAESFKKQRSAEQKR
jgi:hypothetical protein